MRNFLPKWGGVCTLLLFALPCCSAGNSSNSNPVERCSNGEDDDGDLDIDCADSDCATDESCENDVEVCNNGVDDDDDTDIDCDDSDCVTSRECETEDEICGNGVDDDGDGTTDCSDPDCEDDELCGDAFCGDGAVDDSEVCDLGVANGAPGSCCDEFCRIAAAGTECRAGSGDLCDPAEVCDGESTECPDDVIAPVGTPCREGSGDDCDPSEVCSGVASQSCPADVVADATTVCRRGSDDLCDPDETCSGIAGETCPDDVFADGGTVCRSGSGDACDPAEFCPGIAGASCPDDVFAGVGTVCRSVSGNACDPAEFCPGIAGASCPVDVILGDGEPCAGNGESECSGSDTCLAGVCRDNDLAVDSPCGDGVENPTCNPDVCDGEGACLDAAALTDGEACTEDGDTCCSGACVMGTPDPGTCDECGLPELPLLHVSIIESRSLISGQDQDLNWETAATSLGFSATIEDQSFLDDIDNLTMTDILVIASGTIPISAARVATVQTYIEEGGGVYFSGEYLSSYSSNQAFATIVNNLGASFVWNHTINGTLAPISVDGCLGTSPEIVPDLTYVWYGCEGTGSGIGFENFLTWAGRPLAFSYCPPTSGYGLIMQVTDQDFAKESDVNPEAMSLMRNILSRLAFPEVCR